MILIPQYIVHPPRDLIRPFTKVLGSFNNTSEYLSVFHVKGSELHNVAEAYNPLIAIYHKLWRDTHTKINPTAKWFSGWMNSIPNIKCGCLEWLKDYIASHEPRFDDWPRYSWELHNAVNAKLERLHFSWEEFIAKWDLFRVVQPKINDLLLVTSLSPLPSHQEQQRTAIDSWKRFGLDVVSVNLRHEVEQLTDQFPDVEFIETSESSNALSRPVPTINSLVNVSTDRNTRIFVVNSDCVLYGSQEILTSVSDVGAFIRHNWTDHLSDATQERWGIDGFLLSPEHAASLPRIGFGIGQPMWDYWLPWHMAREGFKVNWIADRLLYHKVHPVNWKMDTIPLGAKVIAEHYKLQGFDWGEWREQQPYTYNVWPKNW
jgi:hypothetical protein